jgi:hypothetical protein
MSFPTVKEAALALLNSDAPLKQKQGQFAGGMAFAEYDPTPKQLKWLSDLLSKHGLPPLADGVEQ